MKSGQITSIVGGLLLFISALLPWTLVNCALEFGNESNSNITRIGYYGYQGIGLYTSIIGIIITILGVLSIYNNTCRNYSNVILILSIIALFLSSFAFLGQRCDYFTVGIHISFFASIISMIGSIIMHSYIDDKDK